MTKSLSKEAVTVAKEAIMKERQELLNKYHYSSRPQEAQDRLEELTEALREIMKVIYPVVTMKDVYEKYCKVKRTHRFTNSYSPTFIDNWHSIHALGSGAQKMYQVTYNENQKTSYEPEKEFMVVSSSSTHISLVAVEHWYNFNL